MWRTNGKEIMKLSYDITMLTARHRAGVFPY